MAWKYHLFDVVSLFCKGSSCGGWLNAQMLMAFDLRPGIPGYDRSPFHPSFPLSSVGFSVSKLEWSPWNLYFQLPFLGEMFQKITLKGLKLDFRCWRNFEEIFGSCHTLLLCRTLQSWDISHSDKVGSMVNNTDITLYTYIVINHWIDSIARSWQGRQSGKRWKNLYLQTSTAASGKQPPDLCD